ncbi:MAG: methyl-accepting chemotaxis protein [Gallionella sp.]|nr:methyl-accepting chemotaxis protein [Gallionella sp.]
MKLSTRLVFLVAALLALSAVIGGVGLFVSGKTNNALEEVFEYKVTPIVSLNSITRTNLSNRLAIAKAVVQPEDMAKHLQKIADNKAEIDKAWPVFLASLTDEEDRVLAAKFTDVRTRFVEEGIKPAMAAMRANNVAEVKRIIVEHIAPLEASLDETLNALVEMEARDAKKLHDESEATFKTMRMVSIALLLLGAVLGSLMGFAIIRSVLRQLGGDPKDVAQVVNIMASGNFSLQPSTLPVSGSLLANTYAMQSQLRGMITAVKEQAHQVGDMARNLAVSAKQIAVNVNHESDAVSSMAAAIEELSVSTTHISDQGGNAKRIANDSRSNAEQGAQVVNKTVTGLLATAQEIETASGEVSRLGEDASRISDIVKVIKEIADQTNLLALNAAIEAARAGEQGRGFAVVADEVRKLAERTANATNEINQMSAKIGEVANHALGSMGKVVETTREGVADAETAQGSITGIQRSFGEVAKVIDDISASLAEQNVAANDLAKSTERVAAMSEENAGAAQSLLELANALESKAAQVRGAVEVFKV